MQKSWGGAGHVSGNFGLSPFVPVGRWGASGNGLGISPMWQIGQTGMPGASSTHGNFGSGLPSWDLSQGPDYRGPASSRDLHPKKRDLHDKSLKEHSKRKKEVTGKAGEHRGVSSSKHMQLSKSGHGSGQTKVLKVRLRWRQSYE